MVVDSVVPIASRFTIDDIIPMSSNLTQAGTSSSLSDRHVPTGPHNELPSSCFSTHRLSPSRQPDEPHPDCPSETMNTNFSITENNNIEKSGTNNDIHETIDVKSLSCHSLDVINSSKETSSSVNQQNPVDSLANDGVTPATTRSLTRLRTGSSRRKIIEGRQSYTKYRDELSMAPLDVQAEVSCDSSARNDGRAETHGSAYSCDTVRSSLDVKTSVLPTVSSSSSTRNMTKKKSTKNRPGSKGTAASHVRNELLGYGSVDDGKITNTTTEACVNDTTDTLPTSSSITIVLDDTTPCRLVNPLAELGPPISSSSVLITPSSTKKLTSTNSVELDMDDTDGQAEEDITGNEQKLASPQQQMNEQQRRRSCSSTNDYIDVEDDDGTSGIESTNAAQGKAGPTTKRRNLKARSSKSKANSVMRKSKGKKNLGSISYNAIQPPSSYTQLNDWLPLQDLWLGPPDTFPISYWARLLGISLLQTDSTNNDFDKNYCDDDINSMDDIQVDDDDRQNRQSMRRQSSVLSSSSDVVGTEHNNSKYNENDLFSIYKKNILLRPPAPTSVSASIMTKEEILQSALQSLTYNRSNDDIYKIPTMGTFVQKFWNNRGWKRSSENYYGDDGDDDDAAGDDDNIILGRYKDPLYEQLLGLNDANKDAYAVVLGKATSMSIQSPKVQKEVVTSCSSTSIINETTTHAQTFRGSSIRRRNNSSFIQDHGSESNHCSTSEATVVVIPVTSSEHTKLQLPVLTIRELINDVFDLAVGGESLTNPCCTSIRWKQFDRTPTHERVLKGSFYDPLSFLNCQSENIPRKVKHENINTKQNDSSYSFHLLSQAKIIFPELCDQLNDIVTQSTTGLNPATQAGVMDGWVAIRHYPKQKSSTESNTAIGMATTKQNEEINIIKPSTLGSRYDNSNGNSIKTTNAYQHCIQQLCTSCTDDEVLQSTNILGHDISVASFDDDNNDNDDDSENTQPELPCFSKSSSDQPFDGDNNTNEPYRDTTSVAAYLVHQFIWFRDKSQATEESELIVRILAIDTIPSPNESKHISNMSIVSTSSTNENIVVSSTVFEKNVNEIPINPPSQLISQAAETELRLILVSLLVEFARACSVWYAVFPARTSDEVTFFKTFFRMQQPAPPKSTKVQNPNVDCTNYNLLICDIQKVSFRYTMLLYRDFLKKARYQALQQNDCNSSTNTNNGNLFQTKKRRWLLRLPSIEDTKAALRAHEGLIESINTPHTNIQIRSRDSRIASSRRSVQYYRNAPNEVQHVSVKVRVKLLENNAKMKKKDSSTQKSTPGSPDIDETNTMSDLEIVKLENDGICGEVLKVPDFDTESLRFHFMRHFLLPDETKAKEKSNPLLDELISKQRDLEALEKNLDPKLCSLLSSVIDERICFENDNADLQRMEDHRILAENKKMLERRKELHEACQKQLEQEMDAVCDICNDGDVTPDNQILFCDACNVAVHQMCYGIERVPDGDYFCLPCKRLHRDQRTGGVKPPPQPLPIRCELCPSRQGAFVETDVKRKSGSSPVVKWVHSVCAKWQGLRFVDITKPDLVEDVTEIKINFRRHGIKCDLCLGEYGAMNKCMGSVEDDIKEECMKWFHVTCARAIGSMRVVHGENCKGAVKENPWKLMCAEHSKLSPDEIPDNTIPVEKLILAAKEFPPEPKPPPEPVAPKPFNTATGKEREYLLARPDYENALIVELLTKKFYGVRCEVCDLTEEDSKNLTRCAGCLIVFCNACRILPDEQVKGNSYYCPSCSYIGEKRKAGEEIEETPRCAVCFQNGGFLRKAFAKPVTRKSYWKTNQKEFKKSLYGKQIWVHAMCAFWHPKLELPFDTGLVDLSNVVLAHGRSLIQNRIQCYVCGQIGGMKVFCAHEGCRTLDGQQTAFHVTCARQAGLEVGLGEADDPNFHVYCYRHGGNMYNLRAKLEDMIEHEKRRAGKDFARADAPMKFSNASKILNAGVQIIRILGWAWRWAEWWVEYDSSWEPLLEPGQCESNMTKEELRIVDSTRKSRCEDARRCRLAAFGAALRNRAYDADDGFDNLSLDRALRSILHTKSLVGPLEPFEIEFFADWLGRAYRSKSRLLFLGIHRNVVSDKSSYCLHTLDGTPKFTLGERPIPGKQELDFGEFFESNIVEVDNFLLTTSPMSDEPNSNEVKSNVKVKEVPTDPPPLSNKKAEQSHRQETPFKSTERVSQKTTYDERKTESESSLNRYDHEGSLSRKSTGDTLEEILPSDQHKKRKKMDDNHSLSEIIPDCLDVTEVSASASQHNETYKKKQRTSDVTRRCNSDKVKTVFKTSSKAGSTDLANYDISKWNATEQARSIFFQLSDTNPYIQALVVNAARRGVLIEHVDLTTGETKGLFQSMTKASYACGVNRDIMGRILRGEKDSHISGKSEYVWRYIYKPENDESLKNSEPTYSNDRTNLVDECAKEDTTKIMDVGSKNESSNSINENQSPLSPSDILLSGSGEPPCTVKRIDKHSQTISDNEPLIIGDSNSQTTQGDVLSNPSRTEHDTRRTRRKNVNVSQEQSVINVITESPVKTDNMHDSNKTKADSPTNSTKVEESYSEHKNLSSKVETVCQDKRKQSNILTLPSSRSRSANKNVKSVIHTTIDETVNTSLSGKIPRKGCRGRLVAEHEQNLNIKGDDTTLNFVDNKSEARSCHEMASESLKMRKSTSSLSLQKKCARKLIDLHMVLRRTKATNPITREWKRRMIARYSSSILYLSGYTVVNVSGKRKFNPPPEDDTATSVFAKNDDNDSVVISQLMAKKKPSTSSKRKKKRGRPPRKFDRTVDTDSHSKRTLNRWKKGRMQPDEVLPRKRRKTLKLSSTETLEQPDDDRSTGDIDFVV